MKNKDTEFGDEPHRVSGMLLYAATDEAIGVCISVKGLKLPALFPRQRMPEVGGRVALLVIGDRLTVICGEKVLPSGIAVGIRNAVLAYDIPIAVVHHCVDGFAVQRFCQKLTELIVGVFRDSVNAVRYLCYAFFLAFRVPLYHFRQQRSTKNSAPHSRCGVKLRFLIFKNRDSSKSQRFWHIIKHILY